MNLSPNPITNLGFTMSTGVCAILLLVIGLFFRIVALIALKLLARKLQ